MIIKKDCPAITKSEKTKQKIITAAVKLFSEKSYNGTTTKEIAEIADVSEGTIFRYFKTKKDLLLTLAGSIVIDTLADLMQEMAGVDDETLLTAIIKNRIQVITGNKEIIKVIFFESTFYPELRERFVREVVVKVIGLLEQYIADKIARGEYRQINPKISVMAMTGMVGIFLAWRDFLQADKIENFNEDELVRELVNIFLYGVKSNDQEGCKNV